MVQKKLFVRHQIAKIFDADRASLHSSDPLRQLAKTMVIQTPRIIQIGEETNFVFNAIQ